MKKGHMLRILSNCAWDLPRLLEEPETSWQSLDVDYDPPRVERLWRTVFYRDTGESGGEYRFYLHRIHPCEDPLYHPHPWPSAVAVLSGSYEMSVGHGPGEKGPPVAMTSRLSPGSSYEMIDPDGWHSVRPLGQASLSLMVTGAPWSRWSPKPAGKRKLEPLSSAKKVELIEIFGKLISP